MHYGRLLFSEIIKGVCTAGGGGINGNPHSFYILQFVSESESELEFGSI